MTRSDAAGGGTAHGGDVGQAPAQIGVRCWRAHQAQPAGEKLLAAVQFGGGGRTPEAPLAVHVALRPLNDSPSVEGWLARGPVHVGQLGRVRYAHDEHHLFAVIEEDEQAHGGVRATAASVYTEMQRFQEASSFQHVLRMWNYLDAINEGHGDRERYREFCTGRAQAMASFATERLPAASAIGRHDATGRLQVFWLAGRREGAAVENPRQVSAYRYPRMHGPASPTFSRATIAHCGIVLISGTASIIGHASHHHDDPLAQLDETVRNLDALVAHARVHRASEQRQLLKVYVRDASHAEAIERRLRQIYPESDLMMLAADICRRELLLEIEGVR